MPTVVTLSVALNAPAVPVSWETVSTVQVRAYLVTFVYVRLYDMYTANPLHV